MPQVRGIHQVRSFRTHESSLRSLLNNSALSGRFFDAKRTSTVWRCAYGELSLAPYRPDDICPLDEIAVERRSRQRCRGIATFDTGGPSLEVENEIGIPIVIDVLDVPCVVSLLRPLGPKRTVKGSMVVVLKDCFVVRMATGITPLLLGLMELTELPGLTSILTSTIAFSVSKTSSVAISQPKQGFHPPATYTLPLMTPTSPKRSRPVGMGTSSRHSSRVGSYTSTVCKGGELKLAMPVMT